MAAPTIDTGLQLLGYVAIFAAVPVAFVLLFRALDYVSFDDAGEQYAQGSQDWPMYPERHVDGEVPAHRDDEDADQNLREQPDDGVPCPRCGTHNVPEYTYCRSCVTRVTA